MHSPRLKLKAHFEASLLHPKPACTCAAWQHGQIQFSSVRSPFIPHSFPIHSPDVVAGDSYAPQLAFSSLLLFPYTCPTPMLNLCKPTRVPPPAPRVPYPHAHSHRILAIPSPHLNCRRLARMIRVPVVSVTTQLMWSFESPSCMYI